LLKYRKEKGVKDGYGKKGLFTKKKKRNPAQKNIYSRKGRGPRRMKKISYPEALGGLCFTDVGARPKNDELRHFFFESVRLVKKANGLS
jgi:hypothetical protein